MAVLQIEPYPATVDFTEGYSLDRGRSFKRKVRAQDNKEYDCYLKAAYQTNLWPIRLKSSSLQPINRFENIDRQYQAARSVLHLQLETVNGVNFSDLMLKNLRFFINSSNPGCYKLYDRLQNNLIAAVTEQDPNNPQTGFNSTSLNWLGYEKAHAVLPYSRRSHPGYRLIQEYFCFPDKFLFFDVENIQSESTGNQLDLYFVFNVDLSDEKILEADSLLLNCVPVVNLFHSVTEPVKLDHKEFEYLLVPDIQQYRCSEIHTIHRVVSTDARGLSREIPAFLPERDVYQIEHESDFWSSRRDFVERKRFPGTEMYLSFHDQNFSNTRPHGHSIYAEATCTNRDLAEHMRIGTRVLLVGEGPANSVSLVTKPTRYKAPALRGKQPWELVSHLTLNFSTLGNSTHGGSSSGTIGQQEVENLASLGAARSEHEIPVNKENVLLIQNLLRMYGETQNISHQRLIDSVLDITVEQSVAHVGRDAWRGFTQGSQINLLLDEARMDHTSIFLFGEIMQRFFALYTTVNSFVSLQLLSNQHDEVLKTWPAMSGEKALL